MVRKVNVCNAILLGMQDLMSAAGFKAIHFDAVVICSCD